MKEEKERMSNGWEVEGERSQAALFFDLDFWAWNQRGTRKKKKRHGMGLGHITCASLLSERTCCSWRSELGRTNEGKRRNKNGGTRELGQEMERGRKGGWAPVWAAAWA